MNTTHLALALAIVLAGSTARAADKAPAGKARTVEVTLTEQGLSPAEVKLTKGEPVHMGLTRKTDHTCMTEVVIADVGVKAALPLGKTVWVDFTPNKTGSLRVLCGMGMEFGKLVVN
ncbi:MAG TPA: cupredoxin domain-containing protein [Anaeromyxobacter sp.]|nr:cupredoxin domain-containing protein [Anaeromyxobacter sp.]